MKQLTRRAFVRNLAAGACCATAYGLSPKLGLSSAQALPPSPKRLLIIFLGGGADSLSLCQPASSALASVRPTLYKNPSTLLSLGSTNFGLHPALTSFKSNFDLGRLAFIPNVGPDNTSGSHETAARDYALGLTDARDSTETDGWVNRLARLNPSSFTSSLSVMDLTGGDDTTSAGPFQPTAVTSLSQLSYSSYLSSSESGFRLDTASALINMAQGNSTIQSAKSSWGTVSNSVDVIKSAIATTIPSPAFPTTTIGSRLSQIFISFASLGSSIGYVGLGGFDFHDLQDFQDPTKTLPMGLTKLTSELSAALAVFETNMIARGLWNDTVVAVYGEFGRTNRENGTAGTDHGLSQTVFLMGPSIQGGLYGSIPTDAEILSASNALKPKTNFVDILWELVSWLGYNPATVFPTHTRDRIGFLV